MPGLDDEDISQTKFAGLTTFANLPYVHCLAADEDDEEEEEEGEDDGRKKNNKEKRKKKRSGGVEKFDIAILGAPFDTVSICLFLSFFSFILMYRALLTTGLTTTTSSFSPEANFLILILIFLSQGVTARPGARFGPLGIRQGSRRIAPDFSWSVYTGQNPFKQGLKIVDCGDAPLTVLDNTIALRQLERAHKVCNVPYLMGDLWVERGFWNWNC